mgnify:CR=1 FL=1
MKTIGLIGGMSWESTIPYYRIVNERMRERLGGLGWLAGLAGLGFWLAGRRRR